MFCIHMDVLFDTKEGPSQFEEHWSAFGENLDALENALTAVQRISPTLLHLKDVITLLEEFKKIDASDPEQKFIKLIELKSLCINLDWGLRMADVAPHQRGPVSATIAKMQGVLKKTNEMIAMCAEASATQAEFPDRLGADFRNAIVCLVRLKPGSMSSPETVKGTVAEIKHLLRQQNAI